MEPQKKQTLVEKYQERMADHRFLGPVIVVGICIIGIAAVVTGGKQLYDLAIPAPEPDLEVMFVDKKGPKTELNITPVWTDSGAAGLSAPIPISIGLRNRGDARATNVKVHLVYPPAVLAFEKGGGEPVVPAILADVIEVSGEETAQSFSIERVDVSNIIDDFEKELQLRVRLRGRLGLPIHKSNVLTVIPMILDFANSRATKMGEFPIDYSITYSESSSDKKGILYLKMDTGQIEEISKLHLNPDAEMQLIDEGRAPNLEQVISSEERAIPFIKGDLPVAARVLLDQSEVAASQFIETRITESISEHDRWQVFAAGGEFTVILVDRKRDGKMDELHVNLAYDDRENWHHLEPDRPFYYVPLSNIIDVRAEA